MKRTTENNYQLPQNLFLTMSYQSDTQKSTNDITKEELETHYKTVLGENNIISMEIVKEHHKDGNAHFHIHIKCTSRLKRKFKQLYYMGNVVRVELQKGSDEQVIKYLTKEDKAPLTVDTPVLEREIIKYALRDITLDIPFVFDRKVKNRHYWIWSQDPNYGKTFLMADITRDYPKYVWEYNTEEKY